MLLESLVKATVELQGFRVVTVTGDAGGLVAELAPDRRFLSRCGQCGERGWYRGHPPGKVLLPCASVVDRERSWSSTRRMDSDPSQITSGASATAWLTSLYPKLCIHSCEEPVFETATTLEDRGRR